MSALNPKVQGGGFRTKLGFPSCGHAHQWQLKTSGNVIIGSRDYTDCQTPKGAGLLYAAVRQCQVLNLYAGLWLGRQSMVAGGCSSAVLWGWDSFACHRFGDLIAEMLLLFFKRFQFTLCLQQFVGQI